MIIPAFLNDATQGRQAPPFGLAPWQFATYTNESTHLRPGTKPLAILAVRAEPVVAVLPRKMPPEQTQLPNWQEAIVPKF
jgi:hypothetical protein